MTYLQPVFPFVLLLALVQVIRYRRSFTSPAFRALALILAAIFLASWEPAAWLLSRCLEGRYPPREYPTGDAQAIVVLASSAAGTPPHKSKLIHYQKFEAAADPGQRLGRVRG
jgi:uncharacterized SAM-binding protein YcdF (DUF218 family)